MNSPRTIRSPRATPTKDTRPVVYLYKVEFPDNPAKRIRLPANMKELFKLAGEVLELNRPVKQIYDGDNNPITDFAKIQPKMNLYVSCVAPPPEEDDSQPLYKSRLPRDYGMQKINLPPVKQPKPKPRREDALQHQAIAASPFTVKENLRDSMLALFAVLTPEHKSLLPCAPALTKLTNDTQQFCVEDSMLSQFIGPSSVISGTPLGQETTQWMMDKLKGRRVEDCRFVVSGPPQSGKSTLLSIAVSLFYQKLQLASEATNYLIVPVNWLLHQIYIDDYQKLYGLIVAACLNAIRATRMQYIPIMNALHQWFLSLVTIPAFAPLPPSVLHFTGFPVDLVIEIGKGIHKAWNNRAGLQAFLTETAEFPAKIANAFGYKNAVLVFDHFDASGFMIEPNEHFPESESAVNLSELLAKACDNGPFFVASQDDGEFFRLFEVDEFAQLSTERLITDKGEKELVVPQSQITVNMDMCRGCPAYCAMFQRVCGLASESMERAAVKSQYTRLKSVVDISRNEMLKQEFIRLCLLLAAADTDNHFDEDRMNDLMSLPDFNVRVR